MRQVGTEARGGAGEARPFAGLFSTTFGEAEEKSRVTQLASAAAAGTAAHMRREVVAGD
jgi:hypothetical protein